MKSQNRNLSIMLATVALAVAFESAYAVITVQIGGATRLNSLSRQRERYNCYWDCDLVGCQIAREDDECAYDCEKICRVRYDYAATGRSGAELAGKSALGADNKNSGEESELVSAGSSVRLHLPRNASARNFGFWEHCGAQDATVEPSKLSASVEKAPASL